MVDRARLIELVDQFRGSAVRAGVIADQDLDARGSAPEHAAQAADEVFVRAVHRDANDDLPTPCADPRAGLEPLDRHAAIMPRFGAGAIDPW